MSELGQDSSDVDWTRNQLLCLFSLRDTSTRVGRLQLDVVSAISQFVRDRIAEWVRTGLQRAKREGKRLGRPRASVPIERVQTVNGLSTKRRSVSQCPFGAETLAAAGG
jgi:putative DNA-invertase from lambdoid prophage Rac